MLFLGAKCSSFEFYSWKLFCIYLTAEIEHTKHEMIYYKVGCGRPKHSEFGRCSIVYL